MNHHGGDAPLDVLAEPQTRRFAEPLKEQQSNPLQSTTFRRRSEIDEWATTTT